MKARTVFLIGAAIILFSTFLVWIDMGYTRMTGFETHGFYTGIIGLVALVYGVFYKGKTDARYFPLGVILGAGVLVIWYFFGRHVVRTAVFDYGFPVYEAANFISLGSYIVIIGAIVLLIGSLMTVREVK